MKLSWLKQQDYLVPGLFTWVVHEFVSCVCSWSGWEGWEGEGGIGETRVKGGGHPLDHTVLVEQKQGARPCIPV